MKYLLLLLHLLLMPVLSYSQKPTIEITIHSRVDTSKQEIREIVALWSAYLSSKPDSIYDNPYWNEAEKKQYRDFDLTRSSLYPFSSSQLLSYYKPTILSIEKEDNYYAIRTIFNADGLEGIYKKSNPWCITKIFAVKENNKWKLKNALPILTQNWKRKTIGKITFIYPLEHAFNDALAEKANSFCDSLTQKFQFPDWKAFDFYITKSGEQLGQIIGFDFFFAGYATGRGMNERRILLSGIDSEWYPHEFVHMIDGAGNRHGIVEEGFAAWLSAQVSWETTFEAAAKTLAQALSKNDTITLEDIVNKKWGEKNASIYYYATGAILCEVVYKKGGVPALKKLLNTPDDTEILIKTICGILKIKTSELDNLLRTETLKYL